MSTYIILTPEGQTLAPQSHIEVENLQVLGIIENTAGPQLAVERLLAENPWILSAGYSAGELVVKELKVVDS